MDIKIYKTKLEEEKKILEEELGSLGKVDKTGDWKATPDNEMSNQEVQDEADMADKSEDFEERSSILDPLEKRLTDVNDALTKIGKNKYGLCEKCNKNIETKRLEANVAAKTCENCM